MQKAFDDLTEEVPFDKLHEECGVFAIYGHPEAANLVYLGFYALQHRGQESAGIASSDGKIIYCHRKMGHVADIFYARCSEPVARRVGHWPYALFHRGRHRPAQCSATVSGLQQGPSGRGA